jgi:hypothetical protein
MGGDGRGLRSSDKKIETLHPQDDSGQSHSNKNHIFAINIQECL